MGSYLYSYYGVSDPRHAININSGRYIVADYGNNRVIELNSTLASILKTYSINKPSFVDYAEDNETLLITGDNVITEVTWSDLDFGSTIWQSTYSLNSPQSATYKKGDSESLIIADTDNNRVVCYSKLTGAYQVFNNYGLNQNDTDVNHEVSSFYKPVRAYQLLDGNILVVEKEGRPVNWDTIGSSSSSGSSSSDSSDSSSSSTSELSYDGCSPYGYYGDGFSNMFANINYMFAGYYNGEPIYDNGFFSLRYDVRSIGGNGWIIYDNNLLTESYYYPNDTPCPDSSLFFKITGSGVNDGQILVTPPPPPA